MKIRSFSRCDDLGGNMILLEDKGTRVMMDFGENLDQVKRYFGGSLRARLANGIEDYLEMNVLPDLEGVYRKDYLRHVGKTPAAEPYIDALVISHAHRDHIKFVPYLRADIPIYCSTGTKKIMEWIEDQRKMSGLNHFTEVKKKFWFRRSKKNYKKKIRAKWNRLEGSRVKREFNLIEDGDTTNIGNFEITSKEVNHPVPGSLGFLIESPNSRAVYTGDLEGDFTNERTTKDFIEAAKRFSPDILITEATSAGNEVQKRDSYGEINDEIRDTESLAMVKFADSDLKRLEKVLEAAKKNDRKLVIKPSQAMLIEKLNDAGVTNELTMDDPDLVSLIYQIGWGTVSNKVRSPSGKWKKISEMKWDVKSLEDVIHRDFNKRISKKILTDYDYITPDGIKHSQENFVVFSNFAGIINLIDFKPKKGSKFIQIGNDLSQEKGFKEKLAENWLDHFDVSKTKLHIPPHIMHSEIEKVIEEIDPEKVVPVHTRDPESLDCGNREVIIPKKGKEYDL